MRRSALMVVCLAVFVDMLGFGLILPVLPLHVQRLGGSGGWVGSLLTAYAVAQFVAAPVLGSLSDRYGRRPVLLLSLAGSMISLALTALAGSLPLLLLARVVAGGFGGAIAVGQAYAVDLAEPRDRTRALGLVGASIGLGFVVGPAVGAALAGAGVGFSGTCLVAAGLAGANLAAGVVLLPVLPHAVTEVPDPRSSRAATGPRWSRAATLALGRLTTLRVALGRQRLRPVMVAMFAVTFAFAGMETTFALLGAARFGLGPAGLGVVFACVGVVMVLVQGGMVGRLADRHGARRVAVAGALLLGGSLAVVPFAPAWLAYTALGGVAAGQGLLGTTIAALIADAGGGTVGGSLGGALGVGQSAAAAARAVGPLVAGAAFDLGMSVPYLLGTLLAGIAAALLGSGAAVAAPRLSGRVVPPPGPAQTGRRAPAHRPASPASGDRPRTPRGASAHVTR